VGIIVNFIVQGWALLLSGVGIIVSSVPRSRWSEAAKERSLLLFDSGGTHDVLPLSFCCGVAIFATLCEEPRNTLALV
jgi:hypothetical protein